MISESCENYRHSECSHSKCECDCHNEHVEFLPTDRARFEEVYAALEEFREEHNIENHMVLAAFALGLALENAPNMMELQERIDVFRQLLANTEKETVS